MRHHRVAVVVAVALVTAACTGGSSSAAEGVRAIEVFGPYRGVEADRFVESISGFTDRTGIEVRYAGSGDFVADMEARTGVGSDPPDVALVPQPGLVDELVVDDELVALSEGVQSALEANYTDDVRTLGQVSGTQYGVPFRILIKSLVWFKPDVFATYGWEVPTSLAELDALVEEIDRTDDIAPWCMAIGAGRSTGWAATDWVEDLVLRESGPDAYQAWAQGDLDFASTEISSAFDRFRELVLAPGRVVGGLSSVVDVPVEDCDDPLFADPPGCALYKQADFALSWMPDGTTVGPDGDVDWFPLPAAEAGEVPPLVVGGDLAVQLSDQPEVDELMAYLAGPEAGRSWAQQGGFLSPKDRSGSRPTAPGWIASSPSWLTPAPSWPSTRRTRCPRPSAPTSCGPTSPSGWPTPWTTTTWPTRSTGPGPHRRSRRVPPRGEGRES
ncbi:hypothetical protein BH24ACT4_BH24ACT4_25080 [soil metagenome]